MADTAYSWEDLEALEPQWLALFGGPLPKGFEVTPSQVPLIRRCIAERSTVPLERYVESLGTHVTYGPVERGF